MGKKKAKEPEGPAKDELDPLELVMKKPQSVVLMLESQEEHILQSSCEAMYKFAEKCDENKVQLMELGALDPLLRLVTHEEKLIKRNAAMSLGTLMSNANIRKLVRKSGSIPAIIGLLSPEEDVVCHEFGSLALACLAEEYISKVEIFENGGLEPLIALLSSHDCDVQKNAVTAIALLLQDFQSRAAITELNGLEPLLKLLDSDYPIIQEISLQALTRCTLDMESRSAIRELNGLVKLVDVIGKKDWTDLHVACLQVLANCLEDQENLQAVDERKYKTLMDSLNGYNLGKEIFCLSTHLCMSCSSAMAIQTTGVFDKLLAFVAESTTPEVQQFAAEVIAAMAKNEQSRKVFTEQETEKTLVTLLGSESSLVAAAAAKAIGSMSESLSSRDVVGKLDGIPALIGLLKNDSQEIREAVTLALANLTCDNANNCSEFVVKGGVEAMIPLLIEGKTAVQSNASCCINNIAQDETLRETVCKAAVIPGLVTALQSNDHDVQIKASQALASLVCDQAARIEFKRDVSSLLSIVHVPQMNLFRRLYYGGTHHLTIDLFRMEGGLPILIDLLSSNNETVRRGACWLVMLCCNDPLHAEDLTTLGGLQTLQDINQSATKQSPFSRTALDRLFDNSLPAKYSICGELSPHNLIMDGFYDAGKMLKTGDFPTLEELSQPLDERQNSAQLRPVLLINANGEGLGSKQVTQPIFRVTYDQLPDKPKSKTKLGSQRISPVKSDSKGQEEDGKLDINRNNEIQQSSWLPPTDGSFAFYVQHVTENISPLPSSKEQIESLAIFVSDQMGGPVAKETLAKFSHELKTSEIKTELGTNVIPIGMIKKGIYYHRALLFKALADRIALRCSLIRGDYGRAWNEVFLTSDSEEDRKVPTRTYIVDLMHDVGKLMLPSDPEAVLYQRL